MENNSIMIRNIEDASLLNNGIKMPWLGYGVFKIPDDHHVEHAVQAALEIGYRGIDTATVYGNERGVGKAIRESGVPREHIFLSTKVWTDDMRKNRVPEAFEESLERLQTDYVDLYMIHWPVKGCYIETWQVMEAIYLSGCAKAIGVSNCLVHHLETVLHNSEIVPMVNQVEFHPLLVQPELLKFCQSQGIQMQAASPLMRGHILTEVTVQKMAEKYYKTPAQIVLRWDLQHEVAAIPKSVHVDRIVENIKIFDFEISEEDMKILDALDEGKRIGSHPDHFTY